MKTSVISKIYRLLQARENCKKTNNVEWFDKHSEYLDYIEDSILPHGSGIDAGCTIDLNASKRNKIVINFTFHHLNENGYYEGWTAHNLIVRPGFDGINLHITGKNKNYIKEYLYDVFDTCLTEEIEFKAI